MDKWRGKSISGISPPSLLSSSDTPPPHFSDALTQEQQQQQQQQRRGFSQFSHHQSDRTERQLDGAFERFLTAAIATIITIMFSWRMIDQTRTPASSMASPLPAGGKHKGDEEEEERKRRERNLRGGVTLASETSENLYAASSPLLLSSARPWPSSSSFPDRAGSNMSPAPSTSSSSSSSSSTPTNSSKRRQLPTIPGSAHQNEVLSRTAALSSSPVSAATGSSRFERQQGESLASRLAKISSSSTRGRGVGFRLTNLSPVIRVPVDDIPLCGEQGEEEITSEDFLKTESEQSDHKIDMNSPRYQLHRQDTPHPGVISETLVDSRHLSDLGIDPSGWNRKGPVLYTDLDADSSEELVDSSLEDAESAAGIKLPGTAGAPELGRDLLLNISTDSDSSGGIISKDDDDKAIVDPQQFHAVMTAKLKDVRKPPRRRRANDDALVPRNNSDDDDGEDDDEFLVLPSDSSYRHRYTGRIGINSSGNSNKNDEDYDNSTSSSPKKGGIMGITSYYYEDEDDDSDAQPRELDSDEELYLCSVLEPIIEENSDELSPSSGAESYSSSTTTSSSRSGSRSKHKQHDYDVEYQERKHGLIPNTSIPPSSSKASGDQNKFIEQQSKISAALSTATSVDAEDSSIVHSVSNLNYATHTNVVNSQDQLNISDSVHNSRNNESDDFNTNKNSINTSSVSSGGSDWNYASNDNLIMGIKARYSIPYRASSATPPPGDTSGQVLLTADPSQASLCPLPSDPSTPAASHPRFPSPPLDDCNNKARSGRGEDNPSDNTDIPPRLRADEPKFPARPAPGGQVREGNSVKRDGGDTAALGLTTHVGVAADPDTAARGDTQPTQFDRPSGQQGDGDNQWNNDYVNSDGNEVSNHYYSRAGIRVSEVRKDFDNKDNSEDLASDENNKFKNNSDKTISYNFYSDVTSGVYSSRIIVTGEQEEEVIKSPFFEESEDVTYKTGDSDLNLNLNQAGDTLSPDQLSVSFPTDADYYEYVRCYGSSVDLDSPTSPHSPTSPAGSRTVSEQVLSSPGSKSTENRFCKDEAEEKQYPQNLEQQFHVDESCGSEQSARVKAHSFARTFSTRVDLHDSYSESDESVQTVVSRKGSKSSEPTSSSSASSSHHDSPVHAPTAALSPSPAAGARSKRPLSDGYVYAAKKFHRDDQGRDAFYRDRIVSEGGGVAFGEENAGIADDRFDGNDSYNSGGGTEERLNNYDLRAYRSYSSLHTKGLDLQSDEEKESNRLTALTDSDSNLSSSPQLDQATEHFVSSPPALCPDRLGESTISRQPAGEESGGPNSPADVIKTTTIAFDGADSLTLVVNPQDKPDTMEGRRFRLSREEEDAYRRDARYDYGERRVPEISDEDLLQHPQHAMEDNDDDDEWEQNITETFVVPVSPERTIYQTLQNVKHLLDTRSPSTEKDESASTCTTTMVEVDGDHVGGFVGNDDVTSGYRSRSDALERVDANLKDRLGFKLNMDELRTDGYATESGWPIVRYIEKERVFVDEQGAESSGDTEEPMKGEDREDSGEEYVPDYTDIDADYDQIPPEAEEKMQQNEIIPRTQDPAEQERHPVQRQPQPYEPFTPTEPVTTFAPFYHTPFHAAAQSPAAPYSPTTHKPAGAFPPPRAGRLGSSRSNMPPPPPPPSKTHSQLPDESFMSLPQRPELAMTRPDHSYQTKSPLTSPESEPPPLPLIPPPTQSHIPPPSLAYDSISQPSLLPEEEDFAYIPRDGVNNISALSPQSIPLHPDIPPSMPSTSPHSTFQRLETPPTVVRPTSPLSPHNESEGANESGDQNRDMSHSSDGSDTRGNPPAEFGEGFSDDEAQDGDEDYEYFVKHIADGDGEGSPNILLSDSSSLKTPLSAESAGIPILSGNLASPYAKADVFRFPTEGSSPATTKYPASQTQSSPSYASASKPPATPSEPDGDSADSRREENAKGEKRGANDDDGTGEAAPSENIDDESSVKKPRLVRTSTGTEDVGGFFSGPRRSSAASVLGDESSNILNRSFGEPTSTSMSFALERYDSEPAARSPTKERFKDSSSPFRESPMRLTSRQMSAVSQEPALDVVIEARADAPVAMSSASSTSSDVTVMPADSLESPREGLPPTSGLQAANVEQSPMLKAPSSQLPLTLPPISPAQLSENTENDTPSTPGEEETLVLAEMEQRWENSVKRVRNSKRDLGFANEEGSKEESETADFQPPQIHPIFVEKRKESFLPKSFHEGGGESKGQADDDEALRMEKESDESDETEDEEEEDSESSEDRENDGPSTREVEEVIKKAENSRPAFLTPSAKEPFGSKERKQLRAGSNSVESADENYPAESPPSSGPMSPGISSDSASALEASPSSTKPQQMGSLAHPPLRANSATSRSSPSLSSPAGLTMLTQSSPLSIPFPGTAWAHAQFGQYDKPKGASSTTPKRSMKEVKKMSKTPYKSVLTQNPPASFTTPPSPSPKAAAFVLPDNFLTPSRLKIMNSRNRFLSEGNIQGATEDYHDEFAARKETLLQPQHTETSSNSPTPGPRLYEPKSAANSFDAKNWRYRSMEQLQKLQEMSRMTRKSESDLTHRHEGRHDCLHPDCIFSEKGRREVLDKTLSIDNLQADVYKHLRRLGGSESDAGDAYFPENSSDLFDLTFNNFQNDGRGQDNFDRPHSMSELRHASDYSTISGSSGGYFDTPSSARYSASRSSGGRFAQHQQYKKSKSLCTLETNIDDETFGPSSPTSPGGEELGLQRAPSAHDLRISKSLQKLNVPKWYSQSSLSKYGSLSLLKYGSNSTMSSWQQLPSSLMSSPCTTPSASGNVVIKARVQPPTSARNLRSPRFSSKSAPTTPLFGINGQQLRSGDAPSVKLPSDKMRSQEKAKALMPIPIVPFDKIRAMFEKKKNEDKEAKQAASAAAAAKKATPSPVASPPSFSPPTVMPSPSHNAPKTLAINGRRKMKEDDEDDVYEDMEIVVPKVIVSPTEPHVKGILKRPSQSEKRYSDIQEAPESDEEESVPKPVSVRPAETVPIVNLSQAPDLVAPIPSQRPVIEPQLEYMTNEEENRTFSASPVELPPSKEVIQSAPEHQHFDPTNNSPKTDKQVSSPKLPTPKPRSSGFSFFKKKLSNTSLSSSSDKGGKKSPTSPSHSESPNTSYDSADKFPIPTRSEEIPVPKTRVPNYREPNTGYSSSDQPLIRPNEAAVRLEEAPVVRPPPSVHFPPEEDFHEKPSNHDVFPASSSTLIRRPEPRVHIQETNIDDSSEGSAPNSPAHVSLPHQPQPLQHQIPPEPPSSSPPPLKAPSQPETKPEKKRTWFPKPGKSRRTSKSPASSERGKKEPPSPQSPTSPSNFQVPEMSYEPRRLRSSRSSGLDESFTSEASRSFATEPDRTAARPDMNRSRDSRDSHNSRPSTSRPVDLERRSSVESDRSFSRDLDRVSGRAAARAVPLDLDRSSNSGDKRELTFRERRDREMRRYDPDFDDSNYDDRDLDRRDRDPYGNRDPDRRDRNPDSRRDRDPRRYDMDSPASSAPGSRDRRSRELPDTSNADTVSRRSIDHVDVAISRANRKPFEEPPKIRTWQPKPRAGRQDKAPASSSAPAPAPVPKSNGTASGNYRYPVSGSAFSASKPNMAPGLNTPPMSRHQQPAAAPPPTAAATAPGDATEKSVRAHNKVIPGFQALRQARAPMAGIELVIAMYMN
ncbi:hypothetical protein PoB_007210800 [Plakobranchus ocellatus]|uniref:Uncharacterized protein n=1 Tax=Plakobranchus ocellatus TaxID=259542 RepID=A0AAV4DMQ5_9GAST|nr:hypothetical protein PoB_007210800 [Plakobranchus ocellatus]